MDDHKDWRAVVTATFQDAGYESLTAENATPALLLAEGVKLGLTVLDPDLDGEDGLALMKFSVFCWWLNLVIAARLPHPVRLLISWPSLP